MAKLFFDKVRMTTATAGAGTITLSSAFDGSFSSLSEAMTAMGAVNGDTTDYIVEEGGDFSIHRDAVIGGGGNTVTRGTTEFSKVGGVAGTTPLSLTGTAQVRFFPSAGSLNSLLTSLAGALPKTGGTLTGALVLAADPAAPLQAATKQYADNLIASADAMVWKGVIDCSSNPNYPAADAGWTYKVSVAGKIGGASGVNVEAGDLLVCNVDSTATGNQATVGSSWAIVQTNIDGFATAVRDQIHAATGKTTPVDADEIGIWDSAASLLKKLTLANLKAALKTTAAAIWAGTNDALFMTAKSAADSSAWVTLTSSTAIATDASLGYNFFITLAHNTTLGAPTNLIDGRTYQWLIQQDGTGSRTGAFNSIFEFTAVPTLSTVAGKRDLIVGTYHAASGKIIASFRKGS